MTTEVLYYYLGTNGSILSPIHLEDVYYTRRLKLTPDEGKLLTKDGVETYASKIIPEDELKDWYEI